MQQLVRRVAKSACPHDCPSACALEVARAGRRPHRADPGAARQQLHRWASSAPRSPATPSGCDHPDRLLARRCGARAPRAQGSSGRSSWDAALDEIAEALHAHRPALGRRRRSGPITPAATWASLQRYGLDRLRHAMRYSRQQTTICVTPAESGWLRRRRQADRARSARDGGFRPHRRVGRQSRLDPGQRDDPHGHAPASSAAPSWWSSTSTARPPSSRPTWRWC